jgi:hypothetical protein
MKNQYQPMNIPNQISMIILKIHLMNKIISFFLLKIKTINNFKSPKVKSTKYDFSLETIFMS